MGEVHIWFETLFVALRHSAEAAIRGSVLVRSDIAQYGPFKLPIRGRHIH